MKVQYFLIILLLFLRLCDGQQYTCDYTECMRRYPGGWYWGAPPGGVFVPGCPTVCIPRNPVPNQRGINIPGGNGNNNVGQTPAITDTCATNPPRDTCTRLYGTPLHDDGISCGTPRTEPETLIVNGVEARPHSWPWQVSLLTHGHTVPNMLGHLCGGSIIAHEWVLTAAHCQPMAGMSLVIGMHDYNNCVPPCRVVTVTRAWIHPNYTDDFHPTQKVHNDVALIKFTPPVQWGDTISPVCLPEPFQHPPEGTKCYSTGWGNTISGWWSVPERLQQAQLPLLGDYECRTAYPQSPTPGGWAFAPTKMTCAGDLESGGPDSCNGDSGGPYVCKLPGE